MYTAAQRAINTYAQVGMETEVMSASPQKLILMLFEGARIALIQAKLHIQRNEPALKGECISKAINIIDNGLKASLNVEAGGELAERLYALYDYMNRRLLVANLRNQPEILDEVNRLLEELQDAWKAIGSAPSSQPAPAEMAVSYSGGY